jgi:hypothetical protein
MQQWEYIIVDVRLWRSGEQIYINGHPVGRVAPGMNRSLGEEDSAAPSLYEVLEWLGKNGYEMTGIAPDEHYSKLFFKRPRPPKTLPAPPPVARLTSGRVDTGSDVPLPPRSSGKKPTRG